MYIVLAIVMLVRGFADAIMMRTHQAFALGTETAGYLPPDHFDQIFSAHGTIMLFFMATPLMFGIMNYVVPLQLGARDVAFPFLNNIGFWTTFAGAVLINISLGIGNFGRGGWLMYPPFSELLNSPDTGVDYYLWSLELSGIATTMSGVNFVATIIKCRAPGMTMWKMPVFCWSVLVSNVLGLIIYPPLAVADALLIGDRYFDMNFFTNTAGGNPMVWINYVWIFGHPEVYFLVVPAFGIISEIVPTFSSKRLFGYTSMVWALLVILILSIIVWGHHFFTMGGGQAVNTFFGAATMIIAIPTGVKVFNWLFTMYKGRIRFEPPMLGATRRLQHYVEPSWQPLFITAAVGAFIILVGILCFVLQVLIAIWYGIKHKGKLPITQNDPWGDARTLEWSVSCPPPAYNFATVPVVQADDAYWDMKQRGEHRKTSGFEKIHMPNNTIAGFIGGILELVIGFAMVWHIWWLAAVCFLAFIVTILLHSLNADHAGHYISAEDVQKTEDEFSAVLKAQGVKA